MTDAAVIGIIPARAGFTISRRPARRARRDHPRSRGVYFIFGSFRWFGGGSSPLARGLQLCTQPYILTRGIIPARAGFTNTDTGPEWNPADHPRSRGVYPGPIGGAGAPRGSSPLARGLRPPHQGQGPVLGIIPARAGFTPSAPGPGPRPRDHPRSRGVYGISAAERRWVAGSSPLARGLPQRRGGQVRPDRIIPARAGFTQGQRGDPAPHRDHPRSRGVYCAQTDAHQPTKDHPRSRGVYGPCLYGGHCSRGSSPLARGLPPRRSRVLGRGGIIPARAGFTIAVRSSATGRADHPRSRGVYNQGTSLGGGALGSSPLARGLQWAAG